MPESVVAVVGIIVGMVAGWYWAITRTRPAHVQQASELKRRAKLAEMLRDELYGQIEAKDRELSDLHSQLDDEHRVTTEAETRLKSVEHTMRAQERQLEAATNKLTESMHSLRSGVSETINQSILELVNFQEVGKSLESVMETLTRAVGTMEARLLGAGHQLQEWASSGEDDTDASSIDQAAEAISEVATPEVPTAAGSKQSPHETAPVRAVRGVKRWVRYP